MDTSHRVFDASGQANFAQLSRDYNPIHMDAIAARRTPAGAPIVHGIHSLLWLLDSVAESEARLPKSVSLKVHFRKPIYVGDEGCAEIVQIAPKTLRARILVEGAEAVVASIGFDERHETVRPPMPDVRVIPMMPPISPNILRLEEMEGRSGCVTFGCAIAHAEAMFPSAAGYFGAQRIAALICSSCLIGMVVPGLHSCFTGLEVSFSHDVSVASDALQFSVVSVEPRFRLVRIRVSGGGLNGSLEAVSPPPPSTQPTMARIVPLLAKDEFRGSTALIIGGSRGLGELAAKLIAAGGGRVVITYATGRTDANAVAEEIRKAGGECETAAYDVRQGAAEQLTALGAQVPTHVYYFATPPIFRRKAGFCDLRRFTEFNSFYVAGFLDVVQACLRVRPSGIKVFYPSSEFVDTRPANMTEYAMSKAAAEILCADMHEFLPDARVLTRRLPRLPTDQTSSVAHLGTADPIEVILPIVREMHS